MAWTILSLVLSLSLTGGLMIILIFFVNLVFLKKTSCRWRYYIWIVAIARLLLPFAPEKNLITNLRAHVYSMVQSTSNTNNSVFQKTKDTDIVTVFENIPEKLEVIHKNNILVLGNAKGSLCLFWLMMALLFFIYKVTIYRSFAKFVQAGSIPVDDISRIETLSTAESKLGINKAIDLWVNPLISSPMLIGFFHPRIVLPDINLSEQAFYYTVLHELVHYKRKDMFYKWMVQVVVCIHWFNPLVYIANRSISHLCELSCDEYVVSLLNSKEQCKEYASTILNAMAHPGSYKERNATLTLGENKKLLKERLKSIMNNKKNTTFNKALMVILTGIITFTGIFTGSYTVGASNNANSELQSQAETLLRQRKIAVNKSKDDTISASEADKMALTLIDKSWMWEWVEFYVPYMSEKGVKKLIPASQSAEWAGSVDMTTGKEIKLTKKQINKARKHKPSEPLRCGDIDDHALMIMQSTGNWEYISFMLPYMTHKGIRAVVRCYNSKHGENEKNAADYF